MQILKYKAFFISISLLLVVASFALMQVYGVKRVIDFTGGSVIDIAYDNEAKELPLDGLKGEEISTFKTGDSSYRFISSKEYEEVSRAVTAFANPQGDAPFTFTQVSTVGPSLGAEMTKKAIIAIIVVVLAILAFIAFSFREVSNPLPSWKYGVVAMVTLLHDIIVPTGMYVILSNRYGAEVDTLFVIALLTIIGISISDKIVVFDRIRENLKTSSSKSFDEIVGKSLNQTIVRSINTSLTTVLVLIALFFFGPTTTKYFTFTLMVGIIVGTYSSIFVASPLLTVWNRAHK